MYQRSYTVPSSYAQVHKISTGGRPWVLSCVRVRSPLHGPCGDASPLASRQQARHHCRPPLPSACMHLITPTGMPPSNLSACRPPPAPPAPCVPYGWFAHPHAHGARASPLLPCTSPSMRIPLLAWHIASDMHTSRAMHISRGICIAQGAVLPRAPLGSVRGAETKSVTGDWMGAGAE